MNYLKLGPAELRQAISDPEWAYELALSIEEADDAGDRIFDIDKSWQILELIL
ncbi:DUF1877 family protein, partial [Streptomyces cinereoruber]|uniref:DUF1877 family protein n=1 Tax=Streptomyces cinereoruber TaxID=67260 RepID=UPI00362A2C8B